MSPPLPIPKSYQQLSVVSTLNDGVCSCRNGDLYQSLVPFLTAGSCPSEDRKSASGVKSPNIYAPELYCTCFRYGSIAGFRVIDIGFQTVILHNHPFVGKEFLEFRDYGVTAFEPDAAPGCAGAAFPAVRCRTAGCTRFRGSGRSGRVLPPLCGSAL